MPSATCSAWALNLDTLVCRGRRSPDAPAYDGPGSEGAQLLGDRYCIYTSETGAATVIDLVTGERRPVDGFVNRGSFLANGSKLLYYPTDEDAGGLSISALGVNRHGTQVPSRPLTAQDMKI